MWTEEEKKALLEAWPGEWEFANYATLGGLCAFHGDGCCNFAMLHDAGVQIAGSGFSWEEAKEVFSRRFLPEYQLVEALMASFKRVKDSLEGWEKFDGRF